MGNSGKHNLPFLQPDSDLLQDLHSLFVVLQLGLHKRGELAHLFNLKDGETRLQLPVLPRNSIQHAALLWGTPRAVQPVMVTHTVLRVPSGLRI